MRILDGLSAGLAAVLPIAALLLVPAGVTPSGTWFWPHGLWFVGVHGGISVAASTALAVFRPANLKVRQQGVVATRDKKQPLIDAVGSAVSVAYWFAWLAFIPVDVFYLRLLPRPALAVSIAGGAFAMLGLVLTQVAIWENPFAAPNVQDQTGRGQKVVDTGVYGIVRHPIYSGNLLLFAGGSLWLGSYAAFIGVGVFLAVTVGRILVEEAHLRANLPGYVDYARRVRCRVIPFVL